MAKTFTRKTAEQHKAERDSLLESIAAKTATLASSEEWARYLRMMGGFRRYSPNNQILIWIQCPEASRVAGFRKWLELDRHVRKGEKAIKIIGYSTKKITETDAATGEETIHRIPRFPILSVFDVSQTEGAELPTGGFAMPTGEVDASIEATVTAWLVSTGWTVETEELSGSVNGYTNHEARRVVLGSHLEPAGRVAVLLHEAGHAVLHGELAPGEYQSHRGICETEAESVAYVLANLLGVPADAKSIPYIAGWSRGDVELITATAANVRRAVNVIAAGIGLDGDEDESPTEAPAATVTAADHTLAA